MPGPPHRITRNNLNLQSPKIPVDLRARLVQTVVIKCCWLIPRARRRYHWDNQRLPELRTRARPGARTPLVIRLNGAGGLCGGYPPSARLPRKKMPTKTNIMIAVAVALYPWITPTEAKREKKKRRTNQNNNESRSFINETTTTNTDFFSDRCSEIKIEGGSWNNRVSIQYDKKRTLLFQRPVRFKPRR